MAAAMGPAVATGLVAATAGWVALTWAAATLSVGATPVRVSRPALPRAALLLVLQFLLAGSAVALIILAPVCGLEPAASGTTASVTVFTVLRGCTVDSTIRTGGGILIRGSTTTSNMRLAWPTR